MKIKKYKKLKSNKYEVIFDETSVKLYDDVIVKFELLRKEEISDDLFKEVITYNDTLEAYYKSLKYITKKLRTEKEIVDYLKEDYSRSAINLTIERLKNSGYLDEDVYLKSYLNDQVNLGLWGPNKIKKELVKLGLDEDRISDYLEKINDEVWIGKIERIVTKRIAGNKKYGINKLKEKLLFDLSNMGYYKWMIEDVIKRSEYQDNSNILQKEYLKIYNKLSKRYNGYELNSKIVSKLLLKGFLYDEIKNIVDQNKKDY